MRGGFQQDVLDFTYVLAGRSFEELPERALATVRMVHGNPSRVSLPWNYMIADETAAETDFKPKVPLVDSTTSMDTAALYFRMFVSDPVDATLNQIVNTFSAISPRSEDENHLNQFLEDATGHDDAIVRVTESSDVFDKAVNEIIHILDRIEVPVKKDQLTASSINQSKSGGFHSTLALTLHDENDHREDIIVVPILSRVTRGDILRFFLASGCSHKKTVIRLVESVTWIGLTFPIDIRSCRVELQNGQFFQQGFDKLGNPVLYFRNMLRGCWRKDVNSSMAAVLHRLEQSIHALQNTSRDVRFTLVVMMGKPHKPKAKRGRAEDEEVNSNEHRDGGKEMNGSDDRDSQGAIDTDEDEADDDQRQPSLHHNPRIDYQEHYQLHSNKDLIRSLVKVVLDHYPERLFKAYVVVGHGNTAYTRTAVGGSLRLSKYVQPARTREKIKFLIRYSDLREYIDVEQLPTIAGGKAPLTSKAFEYG